MHHLFRCYAWLFQREIAASRHLSQRRSWEEPARRVLL